MGKQLKENELIKIYLKAAKAEPTTWSTRFQQGTISISNLSASDYEFIINAKKDLLLLLDEIINNGQYKSDENED